MPRLLAHRILHFNDLSKIILLGPWLETTYGESLQRRFESTLSNSQFRTLAQKPRKRPGPQS
ncbi:hypothetical protein TorRG33x02_065550 [Trema orientale]|uniref:Uncharacterized protein n=1 Tax=Trema orientale TaxID=63057 RepID=A0A2P5FIL1_TREOI|nr:hypothetical protein TorRG33x02_065550 [Trema orientale]